MVWCFCLSAGSARLDIIFDEGLDAWPGIFALQEFQCMVLPKVPSEGVIMFVLEYPQTKVVRVQDVDLIINYQEKPIMP